MAELRTSRLVLRPFSEDDFDRFVGDMLTDPRVVEFYYQYKGLDDGREIRSMAVHDFLEHFEDSRRHGFETWAAYPSPEFRAEDFLGWSGLLHTTLTERFDGPELQYMIAGRGHGRGYATELASAVLGHAAEHSLTPTVIATVDIPNIGSIRVLEKLGFEKRGQIEAYGSTDMLLYRKQL